jgi:hypothetical protein
MLAGYLLHILSSGILEIERINAGLDGVSAIFPQLTKSRDPAQTS